MAHMMNGMNKVLHNLILNINMHFLHDIPIKGCVEEEKMRKYIKKDVKGLLLIIFLIVTKFYHDLRRYT